MNIQLKPDLLRTKCEILDGDAFKRCFQKAIKVKEWIKNKPVYAVTFNQIGLIESCFVARKPKKFGFPTDIVMNPMYTPISQPQFQSIERCASFPGEEFVVMRWREILATYYDYHERKLVQHKLKGIASIVFQHETDHTNGVVCHDIRIKEKPDHK